jgi:hypothetical protein
MHSLGINLQCLTLQKYHGIMQNAKIHIQCPEMPRDNWVDALEQEKLYAHDPDTTDEFNVKHKKLVDVFITTAHIQH